jgi:DNA-binding protein YbaB
MSQFDIATEVSARLENAARRAGMSPMQFLRDGMSGTSADGSVQVWVDGLGRVQRVRIAPGTVTEGDEERLSVAFAEAARTAAGAITDLLTPETLRQRLRELPEPQSFSVHRAPQPQRTTRTDDDDDVVPVIIDRG